jgi:hypothetical protein
MARRRRFPIVVAVAVAVPLAAGVAGVVRGGGGSGSRPARPTAAPAATSTWAATSPPPQPSSFAQLRPPRGLDGTLAVMSSDCVLDLVSLRTGATRRVTGTGDRCGLAASPNGRWLAIGEAAGRAGAGAPGVALLDAAATPPRAATVARCRGWYAVGDDGRVAACGGERPRIVERDGRVTEAPVGDVGVFVGDTLLLDDFGRLRTAGPTRPRLPALARGELPIGVGAAADDTVAIAAARGVRASVVVRSGRRTRRVPLPLRPSDALFTPALGVDRGGELVAVRTVRLGGAASADLVDTGAGDVRLATAALPSRILDAAFAPDGCCTALATPDGVVVYANHPLSPRWFLPRRHVVALAWLAPAP